MDHDEMEDDFIKMRKRIQELEVEAKEARDNALEEAALGVHDQIFVELEMDLFGEAVRVRSVPLSLRVREPRRRRL